MNSFTEKKEVLPRSLKEFNIAQKFKGEEYYPEVEGGRILPYPEVKRGRISPRS